MIPNKSTKTSRFCESSFAKLSSPGKVIVRTYSNMSSASLVKDDIRKEYTNIVRGKGNFLITNNGRKIFDASCGAAVTCIGYGNKRVTEAISKQLKTGTPYLASSF